MLRRIGVVLQRQIRLHVDGAVIFQPSVNHMAGGGRRREPRYQFEVVDERAIHRNGAVRVRVVEIEISVIDE